MSSTPKRFTRYEAEFHAPETQYVLVEEHDALVRVLQATQYGSGRLQELRNDRDRLQRMADTLTRELADARHELAMECTRHNATRYPVENPANPLLTIESGGIRYVLEVFSDEDYGDWFEVKSATPTEPMGLCDLRPSAVPAAREALRQWREATRRGMEESRGV